MVKHAHGARRQQTRSGTRSNGQACTWRSKATDTQRQSFQWSSMHMALEGNRHLVTLSFQWSSMHMALEGNRHAATLLPMVKHAHGARRQQTLGDKLGPL
eukprot:1322125-Pyramimonas_sp.AAC.1